MRFSDAKETWARVMKDNATMKIGNIALSVCLLLMVFAYTNKAGVVTVIPPKFSEKLEIGKDTANRAYYKAWALSLSELLANTSPDTVQFVKDSLANYFDPKLYQSLKISLEEEASNIRDNQFTTSFRPMQLTYEPLTGKYFVTGTQTTTLQTGESKPSTRTYEFKFTVVDYMPVVIAFNVYAGTARTEDVLKSMANQTNMENHQ